MNKKRVRRLQLLRRALFGNTAGIRMEALILLAGVEEQDGGWLLETVLKLSDISGKH